MSATPPPSSSMPAWLNLGFIFQMASFLVLGAVTYAQLDASVNAIQREIANRISIADGKWAAHNDYHKERQIELNATQARVDTRLGNAENNLAKVDQLAYRLTVLEQRQANNDKSLEDLRSAVSQLTTDFKVALSILQRLDPGSGGGVKGRG